MWQEIKEAMLQTVQTYNKYRHSHVTIARNISIAAIGIAGLVAVTIFLRLYFFIGDVTADTLENTTLVFYINQAFSAGQDVSLVAAGLIAVLLYKGIRPKDGMSFTTSIPSAAWRLFVLSGFLVIGLYSAYHIISMLNADAIDNEEQMKTQLYDWIQYAVATAIMLTTTCAPIFIYLRGIGLSYDPSRSLAFFASALLLFCWVRGMVEINKALIELVMKLFLIVFPTALVDVLLGNILGLAVSIFTILPAAAIISSTHSPDIDIQLDGAGKY